MLIFLKIVPSIDRNASNSQSYVLATTYQYYLFYESLMEHVVLLATNGKIIIDTLLSEEWIRSSGTELSEPEVSACLRRHVVVDEFSKKILPFWGLGMTIRSSSSGMAREVIIMRSNYSATG